MIPPFQRRPEHPKVDAVVDQLDSPCALDDPLDVVGVGLATSHDHRSLPSPTHQGGAGDLVEVPGMGGEAEGQAAQPVGEQPDERGVMGEMSVDMSERVGMALLLAQALRHDDGATERLDRAAPRIAPEQLATAERVGESGQIAPGRRRDQPKMRTGASDYVIVEVAHRRANLGDLWLHHLFVDSRHGEDRDGDAHPFERQDLIEDERLREPRPAPNHVGDPHGWGHRRPCRRMKSSCLQSSAPVGTGVGPRPHTSCLAILRHVYP